MGKVARGRVQAERHGPVGAVNKVSVTGRNSLVCPSLGPAGLREPLQGQHPADRMEGDLPLALSLCFYPDVRRFTLFPDSSESEKWASEYLPSPAGSPCEGRETVSLPGVSATAAS